MLNELQKRTGLRMAKAPFEVATRHDGRATILDANAAIVCQLAAAEAAVDLCGLLNACAENGGLDVLWAGGGHQEN